MSLFNICMAWGCNVFEFEHFGAVRKTSKNWSCNIPTVDIHKLKYKYSKREKTLITFPKTSKKLKTIHIPSGQHLKLFLPNCSSFKTHQNVGHITHVAI